MPPEERNTLQSIDLGGPGWHSTEEKKGGVLFLHPYLSALAGIGAILIVGVLFVNMRSGVGVGGSDSAAWGDANVPLLNPSSYAPQAAAPAAPDNIQRQIQNTSSYTYVPTPSASAIPDETETAGDGFDFDAFVSALSESGGGANAQGGAGANSDDSIRSAYAFLPQGIVAATAPQENRTETQQEIYEYGNETGSFIQSFESSHPAMAQVLKNQIEDRTDSSKNAAVVALGESLSRLGQNLTDMEVIPDEVIASHLALAKSYREIGKNLALVPAAADDADLLKKIEAYNASADSFTRNYVALADLIAAYGVKFSPEDPGSVFTFTPVGF